MSNHKTGDEIPQWHMPKVTVERMRTMAAILRDPNPVHWDANLVGKLGLGQKTINQGPLGLSYIINMLHDWMGPQCLQRITMHFPKAVMSDDAVTAKGVITSVTSTDGSDVAVCDVWLERDGERLLAGTATVQLQATPT
jgi:acyl dehydratase